MKQAIFILLAACVLFACKKDNKSAVSNSGALIGKWNWDTTYLKLYQNNVLITDNYATFRAAPYQYFNFVNATTLKFKNDTSNQPEVTYTYTYDLATGIISTIDPKGVYKPIQVKSMTDKRLVLYIETKYMNGTDNMIADDTYVLKRE